MSLPVRWSLVVLVALSACGPQDLSPEDLEPVSEALTRSPATADWPEVVEIGVAGHGCTASVLTKHWLLTAAHCVAGALDGDSITVRASANLRLYQGPGHYLTHPDYGGITFGASDTDDDMALIRLEAGGVAGLQKQAGLYRGPLAVGDPITIVAFGLGTNPGGSKDCNDGTSGTKRQASYTLKTVETEKLEIDYGWATVCPGDSGSGWLVPIGGRAIVASLTANQRPINDADSCRVDPKAAWIESATAASPFPLRCPQVFEGGVRYQECFESSQGTRELSVGRAHACTALYDGRVRCWGDNTYGQLGDGTTTSRSFPVTTPVAAAIWKIAAGRNHTCGVSTDGFVSCWGSNSHGQLGTPSVAIGASDSAGHVVVKSDGTALSDVRAVTTGGYHSCALTGAGRVYCWGKNTNGQLGNDTTTSSAAPTLVGHYEQLVATKGLLPTLMFVPFEGVQQLEAGTEHTCAIKTDATAYCWGDNSYGQLGTGLTNDSLFPARVGTLTNLFRISAGHLHTCATFGTAGDRVACWGYNGRGQLGTGNTTSTRSPVTISVGLGSAVTVSAGTYHTCFAGSYTGQQKCTGDGTFGALGNNVGGSSKVPVSSLIEQNVDSPAAGEHFTCSLFHRDYVACSGTNGSGQLGQGTTSQKTWFYNVRNLHYLPGAD